MSINDEIKVGDMVFITFIANSENIPETWVEVVEVNEATQSANIKFGNNSVLWFSLQHLRPIRDPKAILRDVNTMFRMQNPIQELKVELNIEIPEHENDNEFEDLSEDEFDR